MTIIWLSLNCLTFYIDSIIAVTIQFKIELILEYIAFSFTFFFIIWDVRGTDRDQRAEYLLAKNDDPHSSY